MQMILNMIAGWFIAGAFVKTPTPHIDSFLIGIVIIVVVFKLWEKK